MIKKYRIHPAIGIARVGNSEAAGEQAWFLGPEAPRMHRVSPGAYRDADGHLRRQGARFRIYEYSYDERGRLGGVREVTAREARIEWRVRLVNRKGAACRFPPSAYPARLPKRQRLRNADAAERSDLVIDSGMQLLIAGADSPQRLSGRFLNTTVILGDLRTDAAGRLIVLGGYGIARAVPPEAPLDDAEPYNNDRWFDDTCDGPVEATVHFKGGGSLEPERAWVVVAPPDYAPPIENTITLYDAVLNAGTQLAPGLAAPAQISFTRDIFPLFRRTAELQWVSPAARAFHGPDSKSNFLDERWLRTLGDNSAGAQEVRERIFRRLYRPDGGGGDMPFLHEGVNPSDPEGPWLPASLTPYQYALMERWSRGDFVCDWPGGAPPPVPLEQLPEGSRPAALDRAALETCVGGPFAPGVEAGYVAALKASYAAPFRLSGDLEPGALTAGLTVPWQADFHRSQALLWPAQRPKTVWDGSDWEHWNRGLVDGIRDWWRLGFVVASGRGFLETERLL